MTKTFMYLFANPFKSVLSFKSGSSSLEREKERGRVKESPIGRVNVPAFRDTDRGASCKTTEIDSLTIALRELDMQYQKW